MSGVHRFLSRREKKRPVPIKAEKIPDHFGGVFASIENPDTKKKPDKDEEKNVKAILERLRHFGINTMVESNAEYALRTRASNGDPDVAFKLLMLLQETYEGLVKPYNPNTKLLGAVNRESVTCYLDALLFAMFARLDSYEAMLYDNFEDVPRKRLAGFLRLWVNMLRTGRLITTDVTKHLQEALAACGWGEAAMLKQQDPSEAFTFITGQLELPLLTLKMDLYHTGKEDPQDDHKFVNERLLEVAIVDKPQEGSAVITLEDCLEHYFNNRIEVMRHLENQRRNTLKSASLIDTPDLPATKMEKESGVHVEVAELIEQPMTPITQSPVLESPITPSQSKDPVERLRPGAGRKRADSIFSQRKVEIPGANTEKSGPEGAGIQDANGRKLSTRTEVLMPAWQFFKLLPWYTDHMPESDAQVAAHFSKTRPVLGICLKRYSYTNTGQATRLNTYIDVPLEIAVPNFVSDDAMQDGPLAGNFRLMLQSVVCHRGVSVTSGHYITLCRGTASNAQHRHSQSERQGSADSEDVEDPWMRFDDLAKDRISNVNIREALKQETPYLLFYQVQPISDVEHTIFDLPSYAEATSRSHSGSNLGEKPYLDQPFGSENALERSTSNLQTGGPSPNTETADFVAGSARTSLDAGAFLDRPRGRSSMSVADDTRASITFDDSGFAGSASAGSVRTNAASNSVPGTPSEEKPNGFLSVANKLGSRRGSRHSNSKSGGSSRSRPSSTGPDGSPRFSLRDLNMSKLTQRVSRGDAPPVGQVVDAGAPEVASQKLADAIIDGGQSQIGSTADVPTTTTTDGISTTKLTTKIRKDEPTAGLQPERKGKGLKGPQEGRDCTVM